ncbi:MAG: acylphosphatase [Candidatus Omnitrophota bacterium]|nr:acylphosphatase [Candidatus Omnitrophota bacterium]
MNKRLHIYYSGSVQGVGFRYTAERTALSLNITGWAKNLGDGRVELVCEGEGAVLNKFLEKIKDVFGVYIRDASIESQDATGEFEGFDIKF